VVRFPELWEPVVLRFEDGQEAGHPDFWLQRVMPRIAQAWSKVLHRAPKDLESELRLSEYGFPRGRVVRQGTRFRVFHGHDMEPFMGIKRSAIEASFGITGLARWLGDDHERCLREDKESIRQVLELRENWKHSGSRELEK
jgi:hypothetical protein